MHVSHFFRSVAEAFGCEMFVVNGPEILSQYYGESEGLTFGFAFPLYFGLLLLLLLLLIFSFPFSFPFLFFVLFVISLILALLLCGCSIEAALREFEEYLSLCNIEVSFFSLHFHLSLKFSFSPSLSLSPLLLSLSSPLSQGLRRLFSLTKLTPLPRVTTAAGEIDIYRKIRLIISYTLSNRGTMERRIVGTLSSQLDRIRDERVVVLAATNQPDAIDLSLRRPGTQHYSLPLYFGFWLSRFGKVVSIRRSISRFRRRAIALRYCLWFWRKFQILWLPIKSKRSRTWRMDTSVQILTLYVRKHAWR